MKPIILVVSWFITGGLLYYSIQSHDENQRLTDEVSGLQGVRQQFQQQVILNTQLQQEFESQIQQLQSNLLGAQTQMSNLSQALQDARELIEPIPPSTTPNTDTIRVQ